MKKNLIASVIVRLNPSSSSTPSPSPIAMDMHFRDPLPPAPPLLCNYVTCERSHMLQTSKMKKN